MTTYIKYYPVEKQYTTRSGEVKIYTTKQARILRRRVYTDDEIDIILDLYDKRQCYAKVRRDLNKIHGITITDYMLRKIIKENL